MKNKVLTEEFEHCVICGEVTSVPVSMPIDWREDYIIGCGQLCAECAKNQHKAVFLENLASNAQILQAVEQSEEEGNK